MLLLSLILSGAGAAGAGAATITIATGTQAISASAPVQHGRLTTTGVASSCASPKSAPALTATSSTFPYAGVVGNNYDDTGSCLTFTLTPSCSPAEGLYSTAYLGSMQATDPAKFYLADAGVQSTAPDSFSATVPSHGFWAWVIAGPAACSSFGYTVTAPVPVATSLPSISGTASLGTQLTADNGAWPGTSGAAFSYHWLRCDSAGSNCGQEAGGYASTFTPSTADEGHTLKVQVTNTYSGASATATSAASNVVPTNPPAPKYSVATSTGHSLTPGTALLANSQGDDQIANTSLPFPVTFDGVTHTSAYASTNGNLQFVDDSGSANSDYSNSCLPASDILNMVAPYWDDLDSSTSIDPGLGIYTVTTGSAPHRTFAIEWRTASHNDTTKRFDFEILLHEDSPTISFVYGAMGESGDSATVGLQGEQNPAYDLVAGCDTAGAVVPGEQIDLTPSAPTISGTPEAGQVLTGADATYVAGITPLSSQTVWQLCDGSGAGCAAAGTGATLPLTSAMIGHTVRLASTATDPEGTTSTVSAPSAVIAAPPGPTPGGGGTPAGGAPPAGTPPGGRRGATRPRIVVLRLASASVRTNRSDALTILASASGRARVVIARQLPGRRGHGCVAPTRRNRRARLCTRLRSVRTLTVPLSAGRARIVLIKGHGLHPGRYTVTVIVTGTAGRSRPGQRSLIVRAAR
ncbi:MAG TPA: hypothetical protein VFN55_10225 [Solirubrobacteraceae bacterium]|nr:hypothetical protein [Solirubrobacteraceae bacterium]